MDCVVVRPASLLAPSHLWPQKNCLPSLFSTSSCPVPSKRHLLPSSPSFLVLPVWDWPTWVAPKPHRRLVFCLLFLAYRCFAALALEGKQRLPEPRPYKSIQIGSSTWQWKGLVETGWVSLCRCSGLSSKCLVCQFLTSMARTWHSVGDSWGRMLEALPGSTTIACMNFAHSTNLVVGRFWMSKKTSNSHPIRSYKSQCQISAPSFFELSNCTLRAPSTPPYSSACCAAVSSSKRCRLLDLERKVPVLVPASCGEWLKIFPIKKPCRRASRTSDHKGQSASLAATYLQNIIGYNLHNYLIILTSEYWRCIIYCL